MNASRLSASFARVLEHSVLTTDVARALRSSVAFAGAWALCLWTGHPTVAVFAATAAQNLTLVDVRGDYQARLAVLFTTMVVVAAATFAGTLTGNNVVSATLMMGALALLGCAWRHLSADYGPNLATISALLFLFALSRPGDWHAAVQVMDWVLFGCAGGILLQLAGWCVRPQHPVRHAVAESWVAASDLISAMRANTNKPQPGAQDLAEKESALRKAVDSTLHAIEAATTKRRLTFFKHLDDATQVAARFATRVSAFNTALETIRARPAFEQVTPTLDLLLLTFSNTTRAAALAIITHRPEQMLSLEARLRRCSHLLRILDTRLAALHTSDAEVAQAREMLAEVNKLIPAIASTIAETVDHGSAHATFALRLPELEGMSLRSLGSWLNPAPQLDPILVRYALRLSLLTMIAVAAYKGFHIPRGYWIPFTIIIVLQPDYGSTQQKAGQRILGTFTGCVVATSLLWIKLPVGVLIFLSAVTAFGFAYFLKRRYGIAIFFVTLMLVLITDAVEPLQWQFAAARLLCTLAGGALALAAAMFFWPNHELDQFPKLLATAVRSNRNYLAAIAAAMRQGNPFAGDVVQQKREAERANSLTSASLQRMLGEPSTQQERVERAGALTAYNQRLTRATTVLATYLNRREPFGQPEFNGLTAAVGKAMDTLADEIEAGKPPLNPDRFSLESPPGPQSPTATLIYGQLGKIITEIEAMTLAAMS